MSGHRNLVEICSSCSAPVHVTSCDVLHDTIAVVGCVAGVGWTRYTVHLQAGGAIVDTYYVRDDGTIQATQPAGWVSVPCPPSQRDFELGCFTTTGGVSTPVRVVEIVTNGVVALSYVNLLTGAPYEPGVTEVFGTDCPKFDWEVRLLCDNRTTPYTPFFRHMARTNINGVATVVSTWDSGIGSLAAQPTVPPANSVDCDDIDVTDDLGCAAGTPFVRRTFMQGQTVVSTVYINSAGTIASTPAGWVLGDCATSPLYEELFRLDWAVPGVATASTGANTPPGYVVGDAGDQLRVQGPVQSVQWHWLEQTSPIADPGDPTLILNPTVMVNGMAHIARVPNSLFNQPFSHERGVTYPESLLGDWVFEAKNGAYIEVRVLRKAA